MAPAAISPESLLLISDRQYESVDSWNREKDPDHHLPNRRDPNRPIFWVEAKSRTKNEKVLIPAASCFLGYPTAMEQGFTAPDSSGLAAGSDMESCIERGILELAERDAVAIWWHGRIKRPKPCIDKTILPLLGDFETWITSLTRQLWLLDLTHDLRIPVIAAITCDNSTKNLSFGFAAARTKEEAAQNALGELVQFEATKLLLAKRATYSTNFIAWCTEASVAHHPFLQPHSTAKAESCATFTRHASQLISLLQLRGIDVIVKELKNDNAPFSVVRVLAPGLRPIWPRFAAGRLYDVAVELGWHKDRMQEQELNPVPIIY
jgi:ribosomal protein S12 methylthiotransferase accessory factor